MQGVAESGQGDFIYIDLSHLKHIDTTAYIAKVRGQRIIKRVGHNDCRSTCL